MEPSNTIVWDPEREFDDHRGNRLRVLRRRLTDVKAACKAELLPFFQELCFFKRVPSRAKQARVVSNACLASVEVNTREVVLYLVERVSGASWKWSLTQPVSCHMTVWRVNEVLDALQVNLAAIDSVVYMQVGGTHLLEVFGPGSHTAGSSSPLQEAVDMFMANALGIEGYEPNA